MKSEFKINAKVENLTMYDMIYIYHHMQIGDIVSLKPKETSLNNDKILYVIFKGFTIGEVRIKSYLNNFINIENELFAEITLLSKEKYLPIKNLDISIQNLSFQLAS